MTKKQTLYQSTVSSPLTECGLNEGLNKLGGQSALLYIPSFLIREAEILTNYWFHKARFVDNEDLKLRMVLPIIKEMTSDTEWFLVNENGIFYSRGDGTVNTGIDSPEIFLERSENN